MQCIGKSNEINQENSAEDRSDNIIIGRDWLNRKILINFVPDNILCVGYATVLPHHLLNSGRLKQIPAIYQQPLPRRGVA